jgi:adenosylhomocysteine nucleosidase
VVANAFVQHDLDASPLFPRYEVPLYGLSRFGVDARLSDWLTQAAQAALAQPALASAVGELAFHAGAAAPRVHTGLVASGDRFVSSALESQALRRDLPEALAVEMEGAAMAQVCHDHGVPFAGVRLISDRADDTAHVDFMRFIRDVAAPASAAVMENLVRRLQ